MESLVSKFSQRGPNHELVVEILNFLFRAMQTFRQQLLPRKRWKDIAFTMEGFANSISRIHAILISVLRWLTYYCLCASFCLQNFIFWACYAYYLQVNNDRSRDYTLSNVSNVPIVNSQPSILGQQPVPMMTSNPPQYSGAPFAPTEQVGMPQPSAGWGTAGAAVPQSMPMPMPNHQYMPPGHGTMPSHPGPGVMHMPSQSGLSQTTVAPYRPDQMQ